MDTVINKSRVLTSLLWKVMERAGTQGMQFVVQIIIARLLVPEQYGIIAIVMVFISIAQVFVQCGLNTALIQKKDADEIDFSSVFYLSLIVAALLYIIIYISAPFIASYYTQPLLVQVLRVLSITLFIGALNSIQNAFAMRNMLFRKLFVGSLGAVIISGVVGITAACNGLGVWALVAQQLTYQISVVIILWFVIRWRPRLLFSLDRIRTLFSFGSKLLISSLVDTLFINLRTPIIGRMYSPAMLGFYNKGQQIPQLIVTNINGSIQAVMLPTLSAFQDEKKRVKEIMRRSIVTSSFFIFPMMIGLAVVAEPLIKIILTDKWLPAVPFLQIFCFSFALWPIHTANLQAINAIGRSDIFLRLEIIKKTLGLIVLGLSLPYGVYAMAVGQVISDFLSTFINAYPNKKLLDYSYKEQWRDIIPSLLIALIMGSIVYLFKFLSFSAWQLLLLQVFVGIILYVGLNIIFKIESFSYLINTIRQFVDSRKNVTT